MHIFEYILTSYVNLVPTQNCVMLMTTIILFALTNLNRFFDKIPDTKTLSC